MDSTPSAVQTAAALATSKNDNDVTLATDNKDLATFGYTEELRRSVGGFSSFALAFSMISVITTVFTLFAQPFQTVGGRSRDVGV